MLNNKIGYSIKKGIKYLLSCFDKDGMVREFHQLKHGPSEIWTTACIGSTLHEFNKVPEQLVQNILIKQNEDGGWSYNPKVPSDADTTLRVIQFLDKIGFKGIERERAEKFVTTHQNKDGGISTYNKKEVEKMGYTPKGWVESHLCVSALAYNILENLEVKNKLKKFLQKNIKNGENKGYWWLTPWYVLYECGIYISEKVGYDPVEISLNLLLKSKEDIFDRKKVLNLLNMQLKDGSFPSSRQFRIPRPNQRHKDLTGDEEIVEDKRRIFSTAAGIVALKRQNEIIS